MIVSLAEIAKALKTKQKYWIVLTGDSITSCEWVHPNWREITEYVIKKEVTKFMEGDWAAADWGIRCFNFAYDGATTRDILARNPDLLGVKPDLVMSLMGGNDRLFDIPVPEHITNIETIVKCLTDSGAKVVWCTSTPSLPGWKKNDEYIPYARATMKIKGTSGAQFVDLFSLYRVFPLKRIFTFISEDNPVAGVKAGDLDPDHPNQLGNAYIAQVILKEVFSIDFDAELYMKSTLSGEKYPRY